MSQAPGPDGVLRAKVYCPEQGVLTIERCGIGVEALRAELRQRGQTLLSCQQDRRPSSRSQRFPLLVFCQQLVSLLGAGLQLIEAVDTLAHKENHPGHRDALVRLQQQLRAGLPFSQALASMPDIFPPLLHTAIEASEQTGDVLLALQRFVAHETRLQALRSRLGGALIYPTLLLTLGLLVVAFLLGYVVPRFSVVFEDRIADMPAMSAFVIRMGLWIDAHPGGALAMLGTLAGVVAALALHPALRSQVGSLARHIPWLGEALRHFALIRLYRSLGMLLRAGIPAVSALDMVTGMVPMRDRARILHATESVREGLPISVALQQGGFTTVVSERLLAVGERSGQMGEMLERSADFLDTDLERTLDRAVRLLEPLLMVGIGVLIGGIVALMYLPIFELADSVG
ncbi:type II secretion system F family protein [Candidatus Symbiobacter mobilis]|uniref:General secretion pathway protein F n=1 Tax=Candidatus Symbiobacter mobilis CR TaxID=946483 RepID=U5N8A7_9BURK|nr:type II secretion system F family protein [Candidatus Symbiobacter mobilis]AGX87796.1 general secretion pathway protein F [Candidatus Symbiobacter mobilis CR]